MVNRKDVINETMRDVDTDANNINSAVVSRVLHRFWHVMAKQSVRDQHRLIGEFLEGAKDCEDH